MYTLDTQNNIQVLQHKGIDCKCPFGTRYLVPVQATIATADNNAKLTELNATCDSRCPLFEITTDGEGFNGKQKTPVVKIHCGTHRTITLGPTA